MEDNRLAGSGLPAVVPKGEVDDVCGKEDSPPTLDLRSRLRRAPAFAWKIMNGREVACQP
jgi:hypothetical protein